MLVSLNPETGWYYHCLSFPLYRVGTLCRGSTGPWGWVLRDRGLCPTLPALVGAGRLCHMLRVQIGFPMPCLSEVMQMETPSEKPSGCLCPGQVCLL